ncbi:unnamed protein product, partial [Laminaria digitata]
MRRQGQLSFSLGVRGESSDCMPAGVAAVYIVTAQPDEEKKGESASRVYFATIRVPFVSHRCTAVLPEPNRLDSETELNRNRNEIETKRTKRNQNKKRFRNSGFVRQRRFHVSTVVSCHDGGFISRGRFHVPTAISSCVFFFSVIDLHVH